MYRKEDEIHEARSSLKLARLTQIEILEMEKVGREMNCKYHDYHSVREDDYQNAWSWSSI